MFLSISNRTHDRKGEIKNVDTAPILKIIFIGKRFRYLVISIFCFILPHKPVRKIIQFQTGIFSGKIGLMPDIVEVPYFTGTFMADHAGAYRSPGVAYFSK
jgi:hypothetical protein